MKINKPNTFSRATKTVKSVVITSPSVSEQKECPNCKEKVYPCACRRNRCIRCGRPVGNITFTLCDDCWEDKSFDDAKKFLEQPKAKHVTNLEISKKLKELGVKQESIYTWWVNETTGEISVMTPRFTEANMRGITDKVNGYSAFLASELGELLPGFVHERFELVIRQGPVVGNWTVGYLNEEQCLVKDLRFFSISLPNAMGKMLIYLLEQNLITL